MSTNRVPPLKTPLQTKAVAVAPKLNSKDNDSNRGKGGVKGVLQGGQGRVRVAEALVKCQMCGGLQKVVWGLGKLPLYHRCPWCRELQPTDGYRVVAYGLGLPTPLYRHELEARKRQADLQKT